jgi:hypothetical protein
MSVDGDRPELLRVDLVKRHERMDRDSLPVNVANHPEEGLWPVQARKYGSESGPVDNVVYDPELVSFNAHRGIPPCPHAAMARRASHLSRWILI